MIDFFNIRPIHDILSDYSNSYNKDKDKNGKNLFKLLCACYEDTGRNGIIFKSDLCRRITSIVDKEDLKEYIRNRTKSTKG